MAVANSAAMKPPTARDCNHLVTFRTMTETRGADGSVIETPTTFSKAWARITPLSGSENYVAQGISASVVYEIWCRYVDGITASMDILWGSREFSIESVRTYNEANRWLVITATEDL